MADKKKLILTGAQAVCEAQDKTSNAKFDGLLEIMIQANAILKIEGQMVVLEDMLKKDQLPAILKFTGFDDVPGSVLLTVTKLGGDQVSTKLKVQGKKVVVIGTEFEAEATATLPSHKLPPSAPPVPSSPGPFQLKGTFKSLNSKVTTV